MAGVTKTWVVNSGRNARPTHAAMDGETVPVGAEFSNGQRWPGDSGDAAEVANCTCSISIEGKVTRTPTGTNPTWQGRVDDFFERAPKGLLDKMDGGRLQGTTAYLRGTRVTTDPAAIARHKETTEAVDDLIEKYGHTFDDDEVLFRGVIEDDGWFAPEVGKIWNDKGYAFASMDDSIAEAYSMNEADSWFIHIVVKKGDKAMPYPRHQAMLLPRDKDFRIIDVNRKKRTVVMQSV